MDVAIGGTALVGVGGGIAELIGFAGIAELAPVKSRGKYLGIALLFDLPFAAAQAYGKYSAVISLVKSPFECFRFDTDHFCQKVNLISSAVIFCKFDLAVGSMDFSHPKFSQLRHVMDLVSSSAETEFPRSHKTTNYFQNRFCRRDSLYQWIRVVLAWFTVGRIQLVLTYLPRELIVVHGIRRM